MIITDEIKEALKKAISGASNPYQLATLVGVRHTTIRDWMNGKTKSISDGNWSKLQPYLSLKTEPQSLPAQAVPAVKVYWNEDIAYFARQIIDAKIGTGCACWISERAYAQRTPEQEKIPITLSRAMLYVLMIIQDYELEVEGR